MIIMFNFKSVKNINFYLYLDLVLLPVDSTLGYLMMNVYLDKNANFLGRFLCLDPFQYSPQALAVNVG